MYRTHLFRSPSIIACFPSVNNIVFQAEDTFLLEWPNVDIVGKNCLVAVHEKAHARLRSFVLNAINRPDVLRGIAGIAAFGRCPQVTFENIGKLFMSFKPGPHLEKIDRLFHDMVKGIRAQPLNFPETAYHRAVQKVEAIVRVELEKRKGRSEETVTDLMDGIRLGKDEEGEKLSDQKMLDNIVSLVVAGYESTIASMWAIYYLAKSPNVLKKLREENMSISQNKKGEFTTSEDVSNMKYTNKETIRMANIVAFVFRLVTKDIDYEGYRIPKGWKESAKPGTYQMLGGGSRICAGNMLARIQLAILLHHLSVGYK
ncbi:hypothetical protein EUGRSUZ_K02921 [Eucalyptus grandis]|uniref:Uncharacterized protein n=2 Tax=Eucalyptus grandis TaxID=71139 RepID=A0ACC3IYG7_EUCGR|nr:hypothetical protein EUGRSUZ_K02921 [Eucalyptus grandis]